MPVSRRFHFFRLDAPLWVKFLLGVVGWAVAAMAFLSVDKVLQGNGLSSFATSIIQCAVLVAYGVASSIALWRSARHPQTSVLDAIVRFYSITSVVLVVMLVLFALAWVA